jgi:hypothetical protein
MKKRTMITDRDHWPTVYSLAGRTINISKAGVRIHGLLYKVLDGKTDTKFKLGAVTKEFLYYVNEMESDETTSIVMLNSDFELVSDNVHASNDLIGLLQDNIEILWMSRAVRYWQRAQLEDNNY